MADHLQRIESGESFKPTVTVLMPVCNGEKYIGAAIESVLAQTFQDFELLIVNDASDDRSVEIAESFADRRIRLIHNTLNHGIAASLNSGLDAAQGKYLARMDCDDLCAPERLEKLVRFMDRHTEIGICGSFITTLGDGDHTWTPPCDDRRIRCRMLFESCIPHPSAILRMDVINRYQLRYDTDYQRAQDYDFWVRCSEHMQLANYPEALLHYRIHDHQIGTLYGGPQQQAADRVRKRLLNTIGVAEREEMFDTHHALSTWCFDKDPAFLARVDSWLKILLAANCKSGHFPEPEFSQELASRLYRACYTSSHGLQAWTLYNRSPFSGRPATSFADSIKLFLRCMVDHAIH